jgi:hypothetical protein
VSVNLDELLLLTNYSFLYDGDSDYYYGTEGKKGREKGKKSKKKGKGKKSKKSKKGKKRGNDHVGGKACRGNHCQGNNE